MKDGVGGSEKEIGTRSNGKKKRGRQIVCLPRHLFQSLNSSSNAWSIAAFRLFCMIARICCSRMLSLFLRYSFFLSYWLISS